MAIWNDSMRNKCMPTAVLELYTLGNYYLPCGVTKDERVSILNKSFSNFVISNLRKNEVSSYPHGIRT